MRSTTRVIQAMAGVIVLVGLGACTSQSTKGAAGQQSATQPSSQAPGKAAELVPADIRSKGSITVASASANAPMEFLDADGKTLIGFDIDFSDAIGASLGLKVEHVASTFDAIIPGLAAGKYELGMSGFFVTPARERVVDFVPYLRDGSALVVPGGNPLKLSMDPTSLCGHRVAGEKGSVQGIEYLPAISKDCVAAGKPPVAVSLFPKLDEAHLALTGGRADAIMEDSVPSGYRASRSNGKYEVAPGETYKPVMTGMALPKGSALAPALKAAIATLAADGTLERLTQKWSIPRPALLASYN